MTVMIKINGKHGFKFQLCILCFKIESILAQKLKSIKNFISLGKQDPRFLNVNFFNVI